MTAERWEEAAGRLRTELGRQVDTEELEVPVPGQAPREHRPARGPRGVVVGEIGRRVEEDVFDRRRRHRRDPTPHPVPEARDHRPRPVVPSCGDRDAGAVDADRTGEAIVIERELAEELGEPPVRLLQCEVDLEEALARRHEALCEPEVVERVRSDVGDAVTVAKHLHGSSKAGHAQLAACREG